MADKCAYEQCNNEIEDYSVSGSRFCCDEHKNLYWGNRTVHTEFKQSHFDVKARAFEKAKELREERRIHPIKIFEKGII